MRLAFSYGDVESAEHDGTLRADGIRDVDDVVRWARRYRQYVVLDMHVAPGGQNPAAYCDGGAGRLWTDPEHQKRFIALWRAIARRYRFEPTVGAYELVSAPEIAVWNKLSLVPRYQRHATSAFSGATVAVIGVPK